MWPLSSKNNFIFYSATLSVYLGLRTGFEIDLFW